MKKLRVVFDCMVFLQGAARKEGPSGMCLDLAWRGLIQLCVSQEILNEVADVMLRPIIQKKFPAINDPMVAAFITGLRHRSLFFHEVPIAIYLPRDPKDEPYLNLALHAEVDCLVTRDADLLDLASETALSFEIMDPVAFLARLRREIP